MRLTPPGPTGLTVAAGRVAGLSALCLALFGGGAVAEDFQTACAPPPTRVTRTLYANPDTLHTILGQARGGDVIMLSNGSYGQVGLNGLNGDFITLTAGPGQHPVMSSLRIAGSHWVARGLTIEGKSSPGVPLPPTKPGQWQTHDWLVRIAGGDNIILDDDTVTSWAGTFPWRPEILGVDEPTRLWSGILTQNTACVTLSGNHISNVFNGIAVEGDQVGNDGKYYRIIKNQIDNFGGDGIDHSVSSVTIAGNRITNGHNICEDKCVHTDGIQGWNFHDKLGIVNYDITIDGNTIIQQTTPGLAVPSDGLQGITIFDGFWRNISITNNVIVTQAWHGITIGGADGLRIVNNTVLASTSHKTWIMAGGGTHEGGVSNNILVRNNIATAVTPARGAPPSLKMDHNLIVENPAAIFVEFDTARDRYDLHPRPRNSAVSHGSPDQAPPFDIEGQRRLPPIDLGAYQRDHS